MAGQNPQKDLAYSVLLDHYGPVLTAAPAPDILTEYYDEDLSLAEIAENFGITRQGVRDAIKHGEAALRGAGGQDSATPAAMQAVAGRIWTRLRAAGPGGPLLQLRAVQRRCPQHRTGHRRDAPAIVDRSAPRRRKRPMAFESSHRAPCTAYSRSCAARASWARRTSRPPCGKSVWRCWKPMSTTRWPRISAPRSRSGPWARRSWKA